ncbi:hypothetical protein R3P38DRAFT_3037892, partial [Favolaschia claudopus]
MHSLLFDVLTVTFKFYWYPYLPSVAGINGLAGIYAGLALAAASGNDVRVVFIDAIRNDPDIGRFVRAHRDKYPAYMSSDQAFTRFYRSIWVQPTEF